MSVKVRGLDAALRALEQELPDAAREVGAAFRLDVAKAIADEARLLAPENTGKLRGAIKASRMSDDEEAAIVYVQRSGKGDPYYWRFLEYGQGPDRVAHGFFLRARERVFGDRTMADKLRRRITAKLKRV